MTITTVEALFHFSFHGDFGSTPTPPSAQKWEYLPHPHEKRPKYLVLNPKSFFAAPSAPQNTPIFLCFIALDIRARNEVEKISCTGRKVVRKIGYFFPWRGGGSNENRSFFMLLKRRLEVDPPPSPQSSKNFRK